MSKVLEFTSDAGGAAVVSANLSYVPAHLVLCNSAGQPLVMVGAPDISIRGVVTVDGQTIVSCQTALGQEIHSGLLSNSVMTAKNQDNIVLAGALNGLVVGDGQGGEDSSVNLTVSGLAASTVYTFHTYPKRKLTQYYAIEERSIVLRTTKTIELGGSVVYAKKAAFEVAGRTLNVTYQNGFVEQINPEDVGTFTVSDGSFRLSNSGTANVGFSPINAPCAVPNVFSMKIENNTASVFEYVQSSIQIETL